MLTVLEIYKKFLLKVNKNDTNTNVKVPKSQFVLLFNEQKRNWLSDVTKVKESSDYIEDIEELLEIDIPLIKIKNKSKLKVDFDLPYNFFKEVTGFSLCSKGECKDIKLKNWFVKPKNINVLLENNNQNPSFDYRETLAIVNNNRLSVYYTDFTVNEVFLTYYREPRDIDIEGYIKIDGSASKDVLPDMDLINIEEVINRTVVEALRNYESTEQLQIAEQRQQQNESIKQ